MKFKHFILEHWETIITGIVIMSIVIIELFDHKGTFESKKANIMLALLFGLTVGFIKLKSELSKIKSSTDTSEKYFNSSNNISDQFNFLLEKSVDPIFKQLLDSFLPEEKRKISDAIILKRISLDDPDEFTLAYLKVFRNFTNSTVVGTSLTDKNYFWTTYDEKNNSVENEIFSFTSSGGKIKRFFYLSEENIKDERTVKVLKKQKEILGVDVWVVKDQKAPRKLFVYCAEKEFGWTAIIDNETKKLKNFIFTKNESDLLEFKITSEKLESIFAIKWDAKVDLKQL